MAVAAEIRSFTGVEISPTKIAGKFFRGAERFLAKLEQKAAQILEKIDTAFPLRYAAAKLQATEEPFVPFQTGFHTVVINLTPTEEKPAPTPPATPPAETKALPAREEVLTIRRHRLSPKEVTPPKRTTRIGSFMSAPSANRQPAATVTRSTRLAGFTDLALTDKPNIDRTHRLTLPTEQAVVADFFEKVYGDPTLPQLHQDVNRDLAYAKMLLDIAPTSFPPIYIGTKLTDGQIIDIYYKLANSNS